MKIRTRIRHFLTDYLVILILGFVALLCAIFIICGVQSENGSITLDGQDAIITDSTHKFIEDANDALYRIMNEDAPTDETTIKEFEEGTGQGASTTLEQVKSRRLPDGDTDSGKGWQCSKYTAYLATGRREYSTSHPDYGPVNGKDVVNWLVNNYGWKYIDKPVEGAIGSGGFNTLYGHTAEYLYSTGTNTAMVSDANFVPLTIATHNLNITGWVWAVPGDYAPEPEPEPTPTPEPLPISGCATWRVQKGDTMSKIMLECEGTVVYGEPMNDYAKTWYSLNYKPGQSVYEGWVSASGVGLYEGDEIEHKIK